jgi:hypothetical protein
MSQTDPLRTLDSLSTALAAKLSKISRDNPGEPLDATKGCVSEGLEMKKLSAVIIGFIAGSGVCGAAFAQGPAPLSNREVVGEWSLLITPAEGQGRSITFKARDGSQRLDFPLAITNGPHGRLQCTVSNDPAECRIRNGELRIASPGDGFTMVFTLRDRIPRGLTGAVDLRVRLMPVGGRIGSVVMARR